MSTTPLIYQGVLLWRNGWILKVHPTGFSLDATHTPHITMLQCFARTADLDKLYAAAGQVLSAAHVTAMKLEAFKYYYAPAGPDGVAGICARPTPEILKLQADIIAAVKPFLAETGPVSAFTAPHADPTLDAALIAYVSTFVPKMSGENFNPHVSTGVAPKAYLDQMLAEPFAPFTFSPAGAAVCQLGPFGTAAKKLKQLKFEAVALTFCFTNSCKAAMAEAIHGTPTAAWPLSLSSPQIPQVLAHRGQFSRRESNQLLGCRLIRRRWPAVRAG